MPKIFQICVEGNSGSTGRIAEEIGILAMRNGWESYIANGRFTRPSKSTLIRIGNDFQVLLHGLRTRLLDQHGLGSKRATMNLIKKIQVINPDLIHLHHLHGYYINIEILFHFLAKSEIPVVWTFHDCWSFTGHCAHFDFIGCNKWQTECFDCPQKRYYPASWLIDRSRKNFHQKKQLFSSINNMTIVSVSKWLDSVVKHSFMSNNPRQVIYNGVDINVFFPQVNIFGIREKYHIGKKFLILGVASPWSERKGLDDFIKLSKLLDDNSIIILVGLNDKQLKNLPENIIGLARTENQQQLRELYSTADLFINLSVEETFGFTNAEALACGTPVIVYNATACPEIIDRNTGIVVEKRDFNGILEAINCIRLNGKDFYTKECRSRVISLFNKEDRYKEYLELYKRSIDTKIRKTVSSIITD